MPRCVVECLRGYTCSPQQTVSGVERHSRTRRSAEWRPRRAGWQFSGHGGAAIGELNRWAHERSRDWKRPGRTPRRHEERGDSQLRVLCTAIVEIARRLRANSAVESGRHAWPHAKAVLKHTHSKRSALPNTLVPGQLPCKVRVLAGLRLTRMRGRGTAVGGLVRPPRASCPQTTRFGLIIRNTSVRLTPFVDRVSVRPAAARESVVLFSSAMPTPETH